MEDENKIGKLIKIIITIVLIIVILAISIIIGINLYNKHLTTTNTESFNNYLNKAGYANNEGYLAKTTSEENYNIQYTALYDNALITKIMTSNDKSTKINLQFLPNQNIKVEYQYVGKNKNNIYGVFFQRGTLKKGKFDCKIITGNNYTSKCDVMKKETDKFNKEVKKIFKENNIDPKYISYK